MRNRWLTFKLAGMSSVADDHNLASLAEKYGEKEGVSYIAFTFHGSAPLINMKGMSITPATMKASVDSAVHCLVNYEHRAEDIPIPRDDDAPGTEVMGHIIELQFGDIPSLDDEQAWMFHPHIPMEPILTRGVMAFFTRISKVQHIANEVQGGAPWYFSLEIGNDVTPAAIWLKGNDEEPHEIIPYNEAPDDLRLVAGEPEMMDYHGRQVGYLMGGADGQISFIGGAVTRSPAGFEQREPGKSLMFIASASGAIVDAREIKKVNAGELKAFASTNLEKVEKRLNRKEGDNTSAENGITMPMIIDDHEGLLEAYVAIGNILTSSHNDQTGGDKKMELTQEELDAKIAEGVAKAVAKAEADAKKAGYDEGKAAALAEAPTPDSILEKAVEDGTHIPADQVDVVVATRMLEKGREASIVSLSCDDDMKADFRLLAGNVEHYPLDEDGEKLFQTALTRWASLKPADDGKGDNKDGNDGNDNKDGGDKGDGADGKKTSSADAGKDLDPGNGSGGSDSDPPEDIPTVE